MRANPIICLMGPTGVGKTRLAVDIVKNFPCEIVSVDSAMVYRDMDIGTAKPQADILQIAPHHLINLFDPSETYSAGQFRLDALAMIDAIHARGKIPLLVGGTMLYFRVLEQGIAKLPRGDQSVRQRLKARAEQEGWETLYAELAQVDPIAAKRIHARDTQRIQRALEVYNLTGKPISTWQAQETTPLSNYCLHYIVIASNDRARLHECIANRFNEMLKTGFVNEVEQLYNRGDLTPDLPSIRSVGYRQCWEYLAGNSTYAEMCDKAIAATRQLAKRQLTWLRAWPERDWLDCHQQNLLEQVGRRIGNFLDKE